MHAPELEQMQVGNGKSGMIGWSPTDQDIDWKNYEIREGAATSWIHVPSIAGGPETGINSWSLASDVFDGRIHPADVGTPFAVARWDAGRISIVNDMLGLVRLFHFRFEHGDVWSTRQGLAHIFMGEAPRKNSLAWAGMATIGWAPVGTTHLGTGVQLPGGSKIIVDDSMDSNGSSHINMFGDWLEHTRATAKPTIQQNVADMERLMSTARRWPELAVADLSGGMDSRVSAALGIRSASISSVRTINSDPGEVDTATKLMDMIGNPVPHVIQEKGSKTGTPDAPFLQRLASNQTAFEGRYLAASAFEKSSFFGFKTPRRPRFNGLGGEVLAGGNFCTGRWREKMLGAPTDHVHERLRRMINAGVGTSPDAREEVEAAVGDFVQWAVDVGASTAGEVLDLFYCKDRMPNWSVTYVTPNNLTPLFAPSVLALAMHSIGDPQPDGQLHRDLIREGMPAWDSVPYYTPTFATRTRAPMWASSEWPEVNRYIAEHADHSESYDSRDIHALLAFIKTGDPQKQHEVAIKRFLWDVTFDDYVDDIAKASKQVAELVGNRLR